MRSLIILALSLASIGMDGGKQPLGKLHFQGNFGCPVAVTHHTYEVTGRDLREVRRQLLERGPRDEAGAPRFAYASWYISWEWPKDESGAYDFTRTEVQCRADLTLPRYVPHPEVTRGELTKILDVLERINTHERNHLAHASYGGELIATKITLAAKRGRVRDQRAANRIAFRVLDTLDRYDREYDRRTHFGETEGVWVPGGGILVNGEP